MAGLSFALRDPTRLAIAERLAALGGRLIGRGGVVRWAPVPMPIRSWFRERDLPVPPRSAFRALVRQAEARARRGR